MVQSQQSTSTSTLLILAAACFVHGAIADPQVMNQGGIPYKISNPPGSAERWAGEPGQYSLNFNNNVKGPVDHFDVYGEVHTKYSQVYWTRNTPIDLPPEIVERFKGKVMAITGYEIDQVTHSGEQPGTTTKGDVLGGFSCYPDCGGTDKSVPSYNAYNHHYFSWLTGKDSEVYDLPKAKSLPNPTWTGVRSLDNSHGFPTNIVFKENPGGEYRKSYHGYPSGYAQLLHSPTQWVVEAMQIDTHNRDYGINDEVGFKPSFLPKIQQGNNTEKCGLSPLIECPCSDRIVRRTVNLSSILTSDKCVAVIATEADCVAAVKGLADVSSSRVVANLSQPSGCIMVPDAAAPGRYQAIFNTAKSIENCANGGDPFVWDGPVNASLMDCTAGSCLPSDPKYGCTEFAGQCTWDNPEDAKRGCSAWGECLGFFCSSGFGKKLLCFGRDSTQTRPSRSATDQAWTKVYPLAKNLQGQADLGGLVNLSISHDGSTAKISMSGPDGSWFGVGLHAKAMSDLPYAIIVDGNGGVSERKLGNHDPGLALKSMIAVSSSSVSAGIRTVVLSRPVAGATSDHYSIPTTPGVINVISAVGNTPALSYHKARTGATIALLPTEVSACVCAPKTSSYLSYMNQSTTEFEGYQCLDEPRSNMLRHGDGTGRNVPNAACHMQTYHGGLQCCLHQFFLTDVEQNAMIPDKTDVYFLKWRYYFQEYVPAAPPVPASHQHLHHWVFLIDAAVNDYEEDNAHYGTRSVGKIEAHLTASQMGLEDVPKAFKGITPLVISPHCHAPSCIREELWNADTGEIICNVTADYPSLKYGSLNKVFNELDYMAIPPCIFGYQPGLQQPFTFSPGMNITAIKYFNNTFRHLGQMAQWTGMMVYDTDPYLFV